MQRFLRKYTPERLDHSLKVLSTAVNAFTHIAMHQGLGSYLRSFGGWTPFLKNRGTDMFYRINKKKSMIALFNLFKIISLLSQASI